MAQWIKKIQADKDGKFIYYTCSNCEKFSFMDARMRLQYKECPNCGAWVAGSYQLIEED